MTQHKHNVTIVGGGFAGVKAAIELGKNDNVRVQLISDYTDFQYYPALYGAATGKHHLESWVPLADIFEDDPVEVILDKVIAIDHDNQQLSGESGREYAYDTVILALGSVTTYFGIEGLEAYSFGIKSEQDIERLKRHIYDQLQQPKGMDKDYVIIGAGPTGVELAAAMSSYLQRLCDKHRIKNHPIRVHLVEAAPRVLPRMSERASKRVKKRLHKLGVKVHTNQKVEKQTADTLMVNGKPMKSHTVIWTSGVATHPFYDQYPDLFMRSKRHKVAVDEYMQVADGVYVLGDNAETPYSGLAQTAMHDALFAAKDIGRKLAGKNRKKYEAVNPPVVVPVGEMWAVFEWHGLRLYGWPASVLRRLADMMGYSDVLPFGQALGVWSASMLPHTDKPPSRRVE